MKIYLKGKRCHTAKCPFEGSQRKDSPPGKPSWRRPKVSEYGRQLREKQKCKWTYGVMDTQFRRLFAIAKRSKGNTGESLLVLLERRLDNVVYRAGISASRRHAKQLICHGHIAVNDRKVNVSSFLTKPGDVVSVRSGAEPKKALEAMLENAPRLRLPSWIEFDRQKLAARVSLLPTVEEIALPVESQLIVEFLSK